MKPGQILVGKHRGVYVIRMVGDVRLTFCLSFDKFIESMFSDASFASVLFDLSDADGIDSTTLGLMAKISLLESERHHIEPVVLAPSASIQRILDVMGFNDIFTIVDSLDVPVLAGKPLHCDSCDENSIKQKIVEAHKILMDLNPENKEAFSDLVSSLQNS